MALLGLLLMGGLGVVALVVGVFLVRLGIRERWTAKQMKNTVVRPVHDLQPGETVAVRGDVQPVQDELLPAPLLDTEGVAVTTEVRSRRHHADTGRGPGANGRWTTNYEARQTQPFLVDDGTGSILVTPADDAQIILEQAGWSIDEADGDLGPIDTYRQEIDPDAPEPRTNQQWLQGAIEPGDEVYVYGRAEKADLDSDADLELHGADRFIITDQPAGVAKGRGWIGLFYLGFGGWLVLVGIGVLYALLAV